MRLKASSVIILCLISSSMLFCKQEVSCQDEIILIYRQFNSEQDIHDHWYSYGKHPDTDSILIQTQDIPAGSKFCQCLKASTLMKLDAKEEAAEILKNVSVGGHNENRIKSERVKSNLTSVEFVTAICEVSLIKFEYHPKS